MTFPCMDNLILGYNIKNILRLFMFTPFCGRVKFFMRVTLNSPISKEVTDSSQQTDFLLSNCTRKDPAPKLLQDSFKNPNPWLLLLHGCCRSPYFICQECISTCLGLLGPTQFQCIFALKGMCSSQTHLSK